MQGYLSACLHVVVLKFDPSVSESIKVRRVDDISIVAVLVSVITDIIKAIASRRGRRNPKEL